MAAGFTLDRGASKDWDSLSLVDQREVLRKFKALHSKELTNFTQMYVEAKASAGRSRRQLEGLTMLTQEKMEEAIESLEKIRP